MIVGKENAVRIMIQCGFNHQPGIGSYLAERAFRDAAFANQMTLGIEADDIKMLIPHALHQGKAILFSIPAVSDPHRIFHQAAFIHPRQRDDHGNQGSSLIADSMNRRTVLKLLTKFISGKHTSLPMVHEFRCKKLTIRCPGMTLNMDR